MIKSGRGLNLEGRNRKVLYTDFQKAGHNGEMSCKNGTLEKISPSEGMKAGRPAKTWVVNTTTIK